MELVFLILCLVCVQSVFCNNEYLCANVTQDATTRQLWEFKDEHPKPIGVTTMDEGLPVEIRDSVTINSDLSLSKLFFDLQSLTDGSRTPQRIVHAKGVAAWGHFEVTNDVSKYTSAKVFNGIGKKTKVLVRFSAGSQERGGTDVARELKGLVTKFYTEDGNLDFLCLQIPVFAFSEPLLFSPFVRAFTEKNRAAGMTYDFNQQTDLLTLGPGALHAYLWLTSDYGIPNGYRKMDAFPIHTYVVSNEKGERHFVRFNFRSEQGVDFLTNAQAAAIQAFDLDYYNRDLYNAIHSGNYPSWKLEMDILSEKDILHVDYNPFDVKTLWKNGTYHTVTIGRLVVDKNSDNNFRDAEQSAFNPSNLVPGIPGPVDQLFRGRIFAYKDIHNYRISRNHDRTLINAGHDIRTYNRDGKPPIGENMNDAPSYYPNSFNGPVPYVDPSRPKEVLRILESNAVDLQQPADFYNKILKSEDQRQRLAENIAQWLDGVKGLVLKRALRLFNLTDPDLSRRVEQALVLRPVCRV